MANMSIDIDTIEIIEKEVYKIRGQYVKLDFDVASQLNIDIHLVRKTVTDNFDKFSDSEICKKNIDMFILENSDKIPMESLLELKNKQDTFVQQYVYEINEKELTKLKELNEENHQFLFSIKYSPELSEYDSETLPYAFTSRGYIILSALVEKREYTKSELALFDLYNYRDEKITIYEKNNRKYVLNEDIQQRRAVLSRYLPLFNKSEYFEDCNFECYLLSIQNQKYGGDWREREKEVINQIGNKLDAIEKTNQPFFFIRLLKKLSDTYDSLIEDLHDCEFNPELEYSITDVRYRESWILMSFSLFYSLSNLILELALQAEIDILSIIKFNNQEYLFDEESLNALILTEEGKNEEYSHHPYLASPLTMPEQITLLEHFGIIDYIRSSTNMNDKQLSILISSILNKSQKNVYDTLGFLKTKESVIHKQKNKDTLERILSKINHPPKK